MARYVVSLLWFPVLFNQVPDVLGRLSKPKKATPKKATGKLVTSPKNASDVNFAMSDRKKADLKEHQLPVLPDPPTMPPEAVAELKALAAQAPLDPSAPTEITAAPLTTVAPIASAAPVASAPAAPCPPAATLPPCQLTPCQPATPPPCPAPCQPAVLPPCQPAAAQRPIPPCQTIPQVTTSGQLPPASATTPPVPLAQPVADGSVESQLAALQNQLASMDMRLGTVEAENLALKAQMQRTTYGATTTPGVVPAVPTAPAMPTVPALPGLPGAPAAVTMVPQAVPVPTQTPLVVQAGPPQAVAYPTPPPPVRNEYGINVSMPTFPPAPSAANLSAAAAGVTPTDPPVPTSTFDPITAAGAMLPGAAVSPQPPTAVGFPPPPPILPSTTMAPPIMGTLPDIQYPHGAPLAPPRDLQSPIGSHGHVSFPPPPPLPPMPIHPDDPSKPWVPAFQPELGPSVDDIVSGTPTPGPAVTAAMAATIAPGQFWSCTCDSSEMAVPQAFAVQDKRPLDDAQLENALGKTGMQNPVSRKKMAREMRKMR